MEPMAEKEQRKYLAARIWYMLLTQQGLTYKEGMKVLKVALYQKPASNYMAKVMIEEMDPEGVGCGMPIGQPTPCPTGIQDCPKCEYGTICNPPEGKCPDNVECKDCSFAKFPNKRDDFDYCKDCASKTCSDCIHRKVS